MAKAERLTLLFVITCINTICNILIFLHDIILILYILYLHRIGIDNDLILLTNITYN